MVHCLCQGVIGKVFPINPFKPSGLFVGHRQTVETQIRRRLLGLYCLFPESSIRILIKVKNTT